MVGAALPGPQSRRPTTTGPWPGRGLGRSSDPRTVVAPCSRAYSGPQGCRSCVPSPTEEEETIMPKSDRPLTMPLLNDRLAVPDAPGLPRESGAWLVRLSPGASERAVQGLADRLRGRLLEAAFHDLGSGIVSIGAARRDMLEQTLIEAGVAADLIAVDTPHRLVRRDAVPAGSRVRVAGATFGQGFVLVGEMCIRDSP